MSSDVQKKFARKLYLIRESRGLSQEELAFMCGIVITFIVRIDLIEGNPSLVIFQKFSYVLGIKIIELLTFA